MPKFFLKPDQLQGTFLTLTGEDAQHAKVLRLKPGDHVTVCDTNGSDFDCIISDMNPSQISLVVQEKFPSISEARCFASIYMAFPKADKLEHVIQKATELGAGEIIAFPSHRCVWQPDQNALRKKLDRWTKIATAAAQQSGRGRIPEILVLPSYQSALTRAATADLSICFYENEAYFTFRQAIEAAPFSSAALLTGPEGGLEQEEVTQAIAAGLQICTLGHRILRCETAPLCALSALMYACGEF